MSGLAVRRSGAGPPLVLIHGSAGGLDSFAPVVPFLEGRELWTYARRAATFADEVDDLGQVLEQVGDEADVLGASYGAIVALHAAGEPFVRSLVLFEPPLFALGPGMRTTLERYRDCVTREAWGEAARVFAGDVAQVPRAMLAGLPDSEPAEARSCLRDLEAMVADEPGVWSTTQPTLLLQGADTWSPMPETMDALAAALPHAQRVSLEGQSHFATHTAPEAFAAAVTRFLSS